MARGEDVPDRRPVEDRSLEQPAEGVDPLVLGLDMANTSRMAALHLGTALGVGGVLELARDRRIEHEDHDPAGSLTGWTSSVPQSIRSAWPAIPSAEAS